MIVFGADTHKQSHTLAAISEATGRVLGDRTVRARRLSFDDLLVWARGFEGERVWAIEDCRHVSGALERFLLVRGERVVRVPPKLMAGGAGLRARARQVRSDRRRRDRRAPRSARDSTRCPSRSWPAPSSTSVCSPIRERLVAQRTALINDLRYGSSYRVGSFTGSTVRLNVALVAVAKDAYHAAAAVASPIQPPS
jgi:transposase